MKDYIKGGIVSILVVMILTIVIAAAASAQSKSVLLVHEDIHKMCIKAYRRLMNNEADDATKSLVMQCQILSALRGR